tara:strand:- start:704 stop:949 length:246 start_codon:yes stop_codon:yes gene_type:complete
MYQGLYQNNNKNDLLKYGSCALVGIIAAIVVAYLLKKDTSKIEDAAQSEPKESWFKKNQTIILIVVGGIVLNLALAHFGVY